MSTFSVVWRSTWNEWGVVASDLWERMMSMMRSEVRCCPPVGNPAGLGQDPCASDPVVHLKCLRDAINAADEERAMAAARLLARSALDLNITLATNEAVNDAAVNVKIHLEDREMSAGFFTRRLPLSITIYKLKQLMLQEYGFPLDVQQWIVGLKMADDAMTLAECGVSIADTSIFLYLTSAHQSTTRAVRLVMGRESGVEGETGKAEATAAAPQDVVGWSCPMCTLVNEPTRPACDACMQDRPEEYAVPTNHRPSEGETRRLQQETANDDLLRREIENVAGRETAFRTHVAVDNVDLVPNQVHFECPICLDDVLAEEGVVLKNCLHCFCRECLSEHIRMCEEAAVVCPYQDGDYSCDSELQGREIKALVSAEVFGACLQRSVTVAESRAPDSCHCNTPNCPGWAFHDDDDENFFHCPVCLAINCLTCHACHQSQTCRQYQTALREAAATDADNDAAARTQGVIQEMLQRGDAMNCPTCRIVIMKKEGCDWIRCSMCKTELCWVTRGLRWGPGGHGDTSAGCRCGVNGRKCHEGCQNCH